MNEFGNRTVFRKIISLIEKEIGNSFWKSNNEYKYSKEYTFRDHVQSMLFLQLSGCEGLRDIDCKYRNSPKISQDFKIPTYSQLSRLNKSKDCNIFRDLFFRILGKARKEIVSPIEIKKFKNFNIIDSSLILIKKSLAPASLFFQQENAAVRLSTMYSYGTELPVNINIVPAKIGERNCINNFVKDKKAIYLFDKGYFKYSWYDEMTYDKYKFITRQQENAVIEEYDSVYTGIDNLYDYTVKMGSDYSKNKTQYKYREILYFQNDSDEEFRLVTNIFDLPAEDIVSLYKNRWDIEVFFKWIKQHLTIKKWIGRTLNAISIQIYCALIVYILFKLLCKRFNITYSLYNLARKIRVNILEKYAISNVLLW